MTDHHDFHTMPAMSRRAFLAGLMAVPAAAMVPGLGEARPCDSDMQDIFDAMIRHMSEEMNQAMADAMIYGRGEFRFHGGETLTVLSRGFMS